MCTPAILLALCTSGAPAALVPVALGALPSAVHGLEDPLGAAAILALIREEEDATPVARFEELGMLGTREAFIALKTSLNHLSTRAAMNSACKAFRHFQGKGGLEKDAISFLAKRTFGAGREEEQRSAVHGLVQFKDAVEEIEDVLKRHRDGKVRTTAIRPLLPLLAKRNDTRSLEVILDNAVLNVYQRRAVTSALGGFPDKKSAALMLRRLKDAGTPGDWKRLLLSSLATRPEAGITAGILREAEGDDMPLALHALTLLEKRCLPGGADPPGAGGKGTSSMIRSLLSFLKRENAPSLQVVATRIIARLHDLAPERAPPSWRRTVKQLSGSREPHRRMAACWALGQGCRPEDVDTLVELLDDREWSVRAASLQALTRIKVKRTLPVIIEHLEPAEGRTRKDIVHALRLMTAMDHGTAAPRWRRWWEAEGEGFTMPHGKDAQAAEAARLKRADNSSTKSDFYGMRVESRRVAFVLDMSGSMNTQVRGESVSRRKVALSQVTRAVEGLAEDTVFNVIFFATTIYPWMDSAVVLDKRTRAEALSFIDRQNHQGGTNIYDALLFAMEDMQLDTLFVMSDGQPAGGPVNDVATIRATVAALNAARGVVIHGIAVGQKSSLLKGLAADSGGSYREVL